MSVPVHAPLKHRQSFSPLIRYPALLLTHGLLNPMLWMAEKAGYAERFWRVVGRNMRKFMIGGRDFGDYQPTAHDVIVCTYPKCGTNWTMQIAYQITMRGQGEFAHIHEVAPWPDGPEGYAIPLADDSARFVAPTGQRIIKTHLEWDRIPYAATARYICVIRDPKDAFVSNYHFTRDVLLGPLMPSVPTWLAVFLSDDAPFPWATHLQSYWQSRHQPNLLLLTFEEMKKDLPQAVQRIADFMEVQLTESEFMLVCEKSAFAYMKKIDHKFIPPAFTPLSSPHRQMIRRGESGGSSELLTAAQQQAIDRYCKQELQRLRCDFPYDEVWGSLHMSRNSAVVYA